MIYNIYIVLSLILLYLYYRSDCTRIEYINLIFIGLWSIFSMEYYTTVDYKVYYENFLFPPKGQWEPLYEALITLFRPLGYVFFNACMAAFEIFTLGFMLKRFVNPKWYWLAIILFIADPNTVFNFMTVKRQFIAMAVTMWIPYFMMFKDGKERYIYSTIALIIAVNIHTAAYMALLFIPILILNKRPNRIAALIIMAFYIGCSGIIISNTQLLYRIITMSGIAGRYETYVDILDSADMDDYAIGMAESVYRSILVFLLLWMIPHYSDREYKIVMMAIVGYFLSAVLFSDIWRLAWFFTMFNYLALPIMFATLWKLYPRYIAMAAIALCLLWPLRQYYIVMSGKSPAHQMYKMQYFYTIFDDSVDKSYYSQEEM